MAVFFCGSEGLKGLTMEENKRWCLSLRFCHGNLYKKLKVFTKTWVGLCKKDADNRAVVLEGGRLWIKGALELHALFSPSVVNRSYDLWLRLCKMTLRISY